MSLAPYNRATLTLAGAVLVALLSAACAAPDFYVNPTFPPRASETDVEPAPTAHVIRSVPFGLTPVPERSPLKVPVIIGSPIPTPSPAPQFKFLVTPTSIVTESGFALPPGAYPSGGPSRRLGSPQDQLLRAFDKMEWSKSVSVRSRFHWPLANGAETGHGDRPGGEALLEVEGSYELAWFDEDTSSPFDAIVRAQPEFHLRFSEERPGQAAPMETEIVARQGRLVTDTTVNQLLTYPSFAEWYSDPNPKKLRPGMAMFLSLSLTGGRIIKDSFIAWPGFETEEVAQTGHRGSDGSEFDVYEVSRVNDSGDAEKWKVWIGGDSLPNRIELTITSEDPARSVLGAELEITYLGDNFRPSGLP